MENAFTIFDVMEKKGAFRSNPANPNSRTPQGQSLYKGPVEYPRMVYHPEGKHKVANPGRAETTPFGPQIMNQQFELESKVVNDEGEYAEAKAAGWHDTPRDALLVAEAKGNLPKALAVPVAPPIDLAKAELKAKEDRIKELEALLAAKGEDKAKAAAPSKSPITVKE